MMTQKRSASFSAEFKRAGGENHYFFCGRDIVAYKSFNVPIESAWNILNESQKGLSGVECHARMSITHYKGKTEVAAVTNEPIPGLPGSENGVVIMKLLHAFAQRARPWKSLHRGPQSRCHVVRRLRRSRLVRRSRTV